MQFGLTALSPAQPSLPQAEQVPRLGFESSGQQGSPLQPHSDLYADGASHDVHAPLPPLGSDFGEDPDPDSTYLFV